MTQTTWIIAEIFGGIALLTLLTAFLTRWFGPPGRRGPAEILKERYARGEITRVEYRQMAEDLGIPMRVSEEADLSSDRDIARGSKTGHAI